MLGPPVAPFGGVTGTRLADGSEVLALLAYLLETRRPTIRRRLTVAVAIAGQGAYLLDTEGHPPLLQCERWPRDSMLSVVTNPQTLQDLLAGTLDPAAPEPGQLFVCGGDRTVLDDIARALGGSKSSLGAHLDSLRRTP